MKVFSGSANRPLAEKVAERLNTSLSPLEIRSFPDGEKRIRIKENLVEENAVLIQSTNPPVNLNYMELFLIADTIKRNGVAKLSVVAPYLGYQRQDHIFREGEGVTFKTMVRLIEAVGIDRLTTFDLHTIKIPEFFKIPIVHLSAIPIFAQKIKKLGKNLVLVSPDMGGIRRIKEASSMLGDMSYAVIDKDRDLETGKIKVESLEGEVKGKTAVIIDDMISTGKTIVEGANFLKEKGAEGVFAFATHGVFSKDAAETLQKSPFEKVFVTDTIYIPEEKQFPKLEIISIADLIAKNLK